MKLNEDTTQMLAYAKRASVGMVSAKDLLYGVTFVDCKAAEILRNCNISSEAIADTFDLEMINTNIPVQEPEIEDALNSMRLECRRLFAKTQETARTFGSGGVVTAEMIVLEMFQNRNLSTYEIIMKLQAPVREVVEQLIAAIRMEFSGGDDGLEEEADDDLPEERGSGAPSGNRGRKSKKRAIDEFGKDLTKLAADGKIDPVIGRAEEINRVIQILARRTKNNPCLVGDPGVGKTAIAEGLALKIARNDIPDMLLNKKIYSIDMGSMVAGSKFRGDFEERIKKVLTEASEDPDIILFIDEIHTLIGAGGGEGSLDAANIMKPMLTKNELRVIGATTMDEYSKYVEKDSALERRFQKVIINEPTIADSIAILKGLRSRYEEHHKIRIPDDAIEEAVKLSARYVTDRFLPDKAIDLIDEAAARKRINFADYKDKKELMDRIEELNRMKSEAVAKQDFEHAQVYKVEQEKLTERLNSLKSKEEPDEEGFTGSLTIDDVADVLSKWSGIPVSKITETDSEKLRNLESELKKRVIGQDEAVTAISKAIRRSRLGLKDPGKPSGSFIFLGTTGVGKTELAKALAEVMFGNENALVRVDMSEYMEKHDVSKLIGSPPGYVGYDEGGQLTEKIRRQPYSVVLFDEIEKAHPDIFNSMLQILDDGRITDGKGRLVDFKNTIIIMTSNIGARMLTSAAGRKIGFSTENKDDDDEASREGLYGGKSYDDAKEVVIDELKKTFTPEFVNRVDEIIFFRMLGRDSLIKIVDLMISSVADRIRDIGISIRLTDSAKELLAKKGYDPQYGARPLRRVIQSMVEDNLSEALLDGVITTGSIAKIDADGDKIVVTKDGEIDPEG